MREFKAPEKYSKKDFTIFLGGTIDMGKSINWQRNISEHLKDFDITILNPRRDDFDESQKQSISNDYFKEQVNWELDGLDISDLIIINLLEDSFSPISMIEIGLYIKENKNMFICCPEKFWRKGNIEVLVDRYPENVTLFDDFYEMQNAVIEICKQNGTRLPENIS